MKYKVLKDFRDKHSRSIPKKLFTANESVFETENKKRAAELQKLGYLGEEVKEKEIEDQELKHVGGGYYELPNGEKVRGKEAAEIALKELADEAEGS